MSRIFDTGWASKSLEALKGYGEITAVVSGTTGTVAMIDSGLAVTPLRERFVDWVRAREFDLIVNATHATSVERMLADCWHLSKKVRFPIIGIDTNSGTVAYWGDVKGLPRTSPRGWASSSCKALTSASRFGGRGTKSTGESWR